MNCEEFMSLLDRFADLNEVETAQLEEHASICDSCKSELEFMKSIVSTAQSLPPIEPPVDFLKTVNERLDKELAAEPKIVYFMRYAKPYINRYATIAACLAIGIAIGANGDLLISRMNDNGDGVISETTVVSDNTATHVADNSVTEQVTLPITEEVIPSVTEAPVKVSKVDRAVSYVNSTPSPVVKVAETAKPVEPSATMVAPSATAVAEVTAAPEAVNEAKESVNDGIMTASLTPDAQDLPAGYRGVRIIDEPEATPEIYAAEESAVDVAAEYSMATTAPKSEMAYAAPLSSTIMVKSADEARAREIIMEFVEATYGNYYMITGDKLYNLTVRLESEGIWYQANITDSGIKVSFKLVTM